MPFIRLFETQLELKPRSCLRLKARSTGTTTLLVMVVNWKHHLVIVDSVDLSVGEIDFQWVPLCSAEGEFKAYVLEQTKSSRIAANSCSLTANVKDGWQKLSDYNLAAAVF